MNAKASAITSSWAAVPDIHAVQAEQLLLGAALLDKLHCQDAIERCDRRLFYDPLHQRIFDTLCELKRKSERIDPFTVQERMVGDPGLLELSFAPELRDHGGHYLKAIASMASGFPDVDGYIHLMRDAKARRNLLAALGHTPDAEPERREPRVQLIPFSAIKLSTTRRYLVKGLIPRVGLSVVWGPPKSGKSFWTFDLAMHVALGLIYRDRPVHQGPVIWCAFEGQDAFGARAQAFRQRFIQRDFGEVPFFLEPLALTLVDDHPELIAVVQYQLRSRAPALVVLDTLNRSFLGTESDDEAMRAYIAAADTIVRALNCAVIIIHHCGIDGTRPRGHTSLSAAVDAQLSVKRNATGDIVVEVELAKDGPQGDTICSCLESVDVGTDEDGSTITSCVILPADGAGTSSARRQRATGAAKNALDLLERAISEAGDSPPVGSRAPADSRTIPISLWRLYCDRGTITESDKSDTRQKAFVRASAKLQSLGLIGVWGDRVWLT